MVKKDAVTQIRAEHSDGRKIWVDVLAVTDNSTKIEIRVGAKGDNSEAEKILNQTKKYL